MSLLPDANPKNPDAGQGLVSGDSNLLTEDFFSAVICVAGPEAGKFKTRGSGAGALIECQLL